PGTGCLWRRLAKPACEVSIGTCGRMFDCLCGRRRSRLASDKPAASVGRCHSVEFLIRERKTGSFSERWRAANGKESAGTGVGEAEWFQRAFKYTKAISGFCLRGIDARRGARCEWYATHPVARR